MENNIALQLLAVDFKDTHFTRGKCALEKAVKRQLGVEGIEFTNRTLVDKTLYNHSLYNVESFRLDKIDSEGKRDDCLIRTILLTKA